MEEKSGGSLAHGQDKQVQVRISQAHHGAPCRDDGTIALGLFIFSTHNMAVFSIRPGGPQCLLSYYLGFSLPCLPWGSHHLLLGWLCSFPDPISFLEQSSQYGLPCSQQQGSTPSLAVKQPRSYSLFLGFLC